MVFSVFSVAVDCCEANEFKALMIALSTALAAHKNDPIASYVRFILSGGNFAPSSVGTAN